MGKLFSLVSGFFGGWQGYVAAFAAGSLIAGLGVWRVESWKEQASVTQAAIHVNHVMDRQIKITFDVGSKFEMVHIADIDATAQRQQEVSVHVTPQIDAAYPVPCGFVRVFNNATHGPLPNPAACPDDAASGVAFSDVGHLETQNDGQYDTLFHQLTALQDWIRQQQALSEKQ